MIADYPLIFALASLLFGILAWYLYKTYLRKYINTEERKKYFAQLMADFSPIYNRVTDAAKRTLFGELNSVQPNVPELKQKGILRILEIGAGSGTYEYTYGYGANLNYYPSNCYLTVVEPNKFFKDMMLSNLKKFPGVHLEKYYIAYAEDMREIEDESFDAVVSTIVGCSVSNLQKVYKEVKRVLVPGGKFLYMDHVLEDRKRGFLLWLKQQLLSLGIWQFYFDGCHLNRNIDKEVEKSQFSQVLQKRFDIDTSAYYILPYVKVHVAGVAIK